MIKAKAWKEKNLQGTWEVYRKLDGVRAFVVRARLPRPHGKLSALCVVSRNGKPLLHLGHLVSRFTDAEVWLGSLKATIQAVKTHDAPPVPRSAIYQLDPPDSRLYLTEVHHPTASLIRRLLRRYKRRGEDGLILRQGDRWLKVKHEETYDVRVTGVKPGKGKHFGKMGALLTKMGKVGTGFIEIERRKQNWVGKTIEVACTQLTPGGKFRHARFVRVREDR